MATLTPNLNLKKPAGTDYVRIGDFNDNADKLDVSIGDLGQLTTDAKASLVAAINEAATKGGANAPYVGENGNWYQWNATLAQYEDTEVPAAGPEGPVGPANALDIGTVQSGETASASITGEPPVQMLNLVLPKGDTGTGLDILGSYATVEALELAVTSPTQGDMYNVGAAAPFNIYMWDETEPPGAWKDQGILQGPPGQDGAPGLDGADGIPGRDGIDGKDGADGAPGPNEVSTNTVSGITGLLKGAAGKVAQAVAGTDYEAPPTITVNANAAPALGALAHNTEYRCIQSLNTTAPTFTIAAIPSTNSRFYVAVIYKSPGTTAPVITNNSGYTAKWQGFDVSSGTFTPKAGAVYRLSIVYDGIYLNIYVSGV